MNICDEHDMQAAAQAPKHAAVSDFMRRFCSHLGMSHRESSACIEVADNAMPRGGTSRSGSIQCLL